MTATTGVFLSGALAYGELTSCTNYKLGALEGDVTGLVSSDQ